MRGCRLLAAICAMAACAAFAQAPETASGWTDKPLVRAERHMVVAAHPLAVDAGLQMLERGGGAVDAAIAAQLVLNLVEPQSSGIGGGGFMLHFDARKLHLDAYDGRETAPASADPGLFLDAGGRPMELRAAMLGGRPVGTSGLLRMLELAHREHGRLPWQALFLPAIRLAYEGFVISPRLARSIAAEPALCTEAGAREYFCDASGQALPVGARLRNPQFGEVLMQLAREGADAFYRGRIAQDMVAAVRGHAGNPGRLSEDDLAGYSARRRDPVCARYRGTWEVCGMPPPSSGAIAVLQTLGMLQRFDLSRVPAQSADAVHLISEAHRLAYADRGRYVGDPDFVSIPQAGLLDPGYLAQRAATIDPVRSMGSAQPGNPAGMTARLGDDATAEVPSTTHLSILDDAGNAVSMTTSIESAFGAKLLVRGFLLNNQLTDFAFVPQDAAGRPLANRVEGGKRPRSSMAPVVVLDRHGRLRVAVGSPGGAAIIQYVSRVLVALLDWRRDMREAVHMGNFGATNGPATVLERGTRIEGLAVELQSRGHRPRIEDMTSGLHGIAIDYGPSGRRRIGGAADPRREGEAAGERSARLRASACGPERVAAGCVPGLSGR